MIFFQNRNLIFSNKSNLFLYRYIYFISVKDKKKLKHNKYMLFSLNYKLTSYLILGATNYNYASFSLYLTSPPINYFMILLYKL